MRSPQEEFLAFIQPYKGLIASAIRRGCGAEYPCLCLDVEQEVHLVLWQRWQDGLRLDYPVSYLYKVALRTALAVLRTNATPALEMPTAETRPHAAQGTLIEELSPAERTCLLTALLDQLPLEQARAVRAYLAGFTATEVAHLYGWSPSVARHRIYRGLRSLRTAAVQKEPA
jgi:DNA-directed RNA polymerase specialized sigma24 family protein